MLWEVGGQYPPVERALKIWVAPPMTCPDIAIMKTLRRVLHLLTVILLKRMSESFFFKATNLQRLTLKLEKRWQIM